MFYLPTLHYWVYKTQCVRNKSFLLSATMQEWHFCIHIMILADCVDLLVACFERFRYHTTVSCLITALLPLAADRQDHCCSSCVILCCFLLPCREDQDWSVLHHCSHSLLMVFHLLSPLSGFDSLMMWKGFDLMSCSPISRGSHPLSLSSPRVLSLSLL